MSSSVVLFNFLSDGKTDGYIEIDWGIGERGKEHKSFDDALACTWVYSPRGAFSWLPDLGREDTATEGGISRWKSG